jgi:hypothetical protein
VACPASGKKKKKTPQPFIFPLLNAPSWWTLKTEELSLLYIRHPPSYATTKYKAWQGRRSTVGTQSFKLGALLGKLGKLGNQDARQTLLLDTYLVRRFNRQLPSANVRNGLNPHFFFFFMVYMPLLNFVCHDLSGRGKI